MYQTGCSMYQTGCSMYQTGCSMYQTGCSMYQTSRLYNKKGVFIMKTKDYVPTNEKTFFQWAQTLVAYVLTNLTNFGIDQAELTPIQAKLAAFVAAFTKAQEPNRGRVDITEKNDKQAELKSALRAFVKARLIYNPKVTDSDKENMGLPLHKTVRTPTPPPKTFPELELDVAIIRQVAIHFKDAGSEKRGKPEYVHGIELRWAILDNAPSSVDDLKSSVFDTASPYTFSFDETQRGKSLYICPRWENNKGDKGPWGEIYKAIVP
jgi:hypothetical protein